MPYIGEACDRCKSTIECAFNPLYDHFSGAACTWQPLYSFHFYFLYINTLFIPNIFNLQMVRFGHGKLKL